MLEIARERGIVTLFSCSRGQRSYEIADLQTIDRLWVKYSNGHFGFSVQKKISQECGSPTSGQDWSRF